MLSSRIKDLYETSSAKPLITGKADGLLAKPYSKPMAPTLGTVGPAVMQRYLTTAVLYSVITYWNP